MITQQEADRTKARESDSLEQVALDMFYELAHLTILPISRKNAKPFADRLKALGIEVDCL